MGRLETGCGGQKGFQKVGLIISQGGFAGCEPVIAQNGIGGKVVRNREREAGVIATVISGDTQVGGDELNT